MTAENEYLLELISEHHWHRNELIVHVPYYRIEEFSKEVGSNWNDEQGLECRLRNYTIAVRHFERVIEELGDEPEEIFPRDPWDE